MSSTISSRSIQFTQSAQSDTNPSILLDGGGISSNYFHKKFKRFASLVNEDIVNCKRCQKQINERTSATNGKDAFCTECRTEISNRKPYKPKFHKATQCQSVNNSNIGHSIQDIIGATNEPKEIKCHSMPQHPAPSTKCIDYSFAKNGHQDLTFMQSQSAGFWGGYHGGPHQTYITRSDSVLSKHSLSSLSDSNEASGCLDLTTHNRNRQRCINDELSDVIDLSKPNIGSCHTETNGTNGLASVALYVETINPLLISNERISPLSPVSVHERSVFAISKPVSPKSEANVNGEPAADKEINAKSIASEFLKIANQQESYHSICKPDVHGSTLFGAHKQIKSELPIASGAANDLLALAQTVVVSEDGFTSKSSNSRDLPMASVSRDGGTSSASQALFQETSDGPGRCELCQQKFSKRSALQLHMNIHYMIPTRRKKRNAIETKANTLTPNSRTNNPRPFKCVNGCDKSFRIHGHLAKHLRSKTHIQTLESLGKLPTGTYALIEAHINLTKSPEIDTTDYDSSLASFKKLAEKFKSESNSPNAKNYENYASDTQSYDETESKTGDESVEANGYDNKRRRLNEDHTDTSKTNGSDDDD